MRKAVVVISLALMLLCLLTGAAMAEPQIVTLGDGAPIPFLEGYTSQYITDPATFRGITGALEGRLADDRTGSGGGAWDIELQNVAVTDDFIAVFFRAKLDRPIAFPEGKMQYNLNKIVPFRGILVNGVQLANVGGSLFREARLMSEDELLCMYVESLETPIEDGQMLSIYAAWDDKTDRPRNPIDFVLDTTGRVDPTVAYMPMREVRAAYIPFIDENSEERLHHYVVERIAFTPFGGRVLYNEEMTSELSGADYAVVDEAGAVLPLFRATARSSDDASAEKPKWLRNELWFLGGHESGSLSLVPVQKTIKSGGRRNVHIASVPVDSLPATVPLKNGGAVRVERFSLSEDGYLIGYLPVGFTHLLSFRLAGADGQPLDFSDVSLTDQNLREGLLEKGGYWRSEHKGRNVPRVDTEELAKVRFILLEYRVDEAQLLHDNAEKFKLHP